MEGEAAASPGGAEWLSAALVAQVRDYAILALDPKGVVQTWNLGAEAVKGYTAEEIIGQHFSVFYPAEDRRSGLPTRLLDRARRDGSVRHTGWRVRKDGTRFWGDVVITALRDETGNVTGYGKVTRDLTEQHQLEASLRASEERFRVLVSQVVDYAIIALDAQGVVQSWNAGAQHVKGYAPEEIIGKHFSVFYPEDDRRAGLPQRLLDEARTVGRVEHTGWRVRKDGTRFWGDVVITALRDESGELTGFGKVTRDLTDQLRLEQVRESFFASVSHDLKTPITALKGFASLIADADADVREDMARRMEANADRLTMLVDDLVDYAQLRSGAMTLSLERVSLDELVRDALHNLSPVLNEHEVVLDDMPVHLDADAHLVERIVTNLLSNAARYSPRGSRISVAVDTMGSAARLVVTDQGRGIAPEDVPLVFEEFQRGRLAEDDGGTGLGLSSVKQVVALHGGEVSIESEVGQGTVVTVLLPVRQDSTARPQSTFPRYLTSGEPL